MTARELWMHTLIELNKVSAPNILLGDFNYLVNKAIHQFCNKRYNVYDQNQQTTDDLRVLNTSAKLDNLVISQDYVSPFGTDSMYDCIYETYLPDDYWHILNCVCDFTLQKNHGCMKAGKRLQYQAGKLTADNWPQVMNNHYLCPRYDRPYFYLTSFGVPDTIQYKQPTETLVSNGQINLKTLKEPEKGTLAFGNPSKVKIEIRYGTDIETFKLNQIYVSYLKIPKTVTLTAEQLDRVDDRSQILEFPDYICFEILNELVKLLQENFGDPRLQTNMAVNQSIAPPPTQQPTKK